MTRKTSMTPAEKRLVHIEEAIAAGDPTRTEGLLAAFADEDFRLLASELEQAEVERDQVAGDRFQVQIVLFKNGEPLAEQAGAEVSLGDITKATQAALSAVIGRPLSAEVVARDEALGRVGRLKHRWRQRAEQLERERAFVVPRAAEMERAIRGRAQMQNTTQEVQAARAAARAG